VDVEKKTKQRKTQNAAEDVQILERESILDAREEDAEQDENQTQQDRRDTLVSPESASHQPISQREEQSTHIVVLTRMYTCTFGTHKTYTTDTVKKSDKTSL
jgi:hypothetical protein